MVLESVLSSPHLNENEPYSFPNENTYVLHRSFELSLKSQDFDTSEIGTLDTLTEGGNW